MLYEVITQKVRLKLRTEDGQNVPVTVDGSAVAVKLGDTVIIRRAGDRNNFV